MSDKVGLVTGSFDPITNGHLDIIKRAARLVDKLYVGIFYNAQKDGYFTYQVRKQILEETFKDEANIEIILASNVLVVDLAKKLGVTILFRGIRNAVDLDYEASLAFFNSGMSADIETVCLLAKPDLQHVSSSRVRELLHFEADISNYVPKSVLKEVEKQREKNEIL